MSIMTDSADTLRKDIQAAVPARVAKLAKIRPSTLYSFLDGKTSNMRSDTRDKVLDALRIIAAAEGKPRGYPEARERNNLMHSYEWQKTEIQPVPIYDIRASAGAGALVEDGEPTDYQPFRVQQLDRLTRSKPENLAVITVSGDSMWETLHDGDSVLVDRSVQRVVREGIYILLFEEELLVKRCQRNIETGALMIMSDNPAYKDYEVNNLENFSVLGRVVWIGRALG